MSEVGVRLEELSQRYALGHEVAARLEALLALVETDPTSLTSVRDPRAGVDVHVADALAGLELERVRLASTICDLGSGAGFPGLVLAVALPHACLALVESVRRKCEFLERAAGALGLDNVAVRCVRAEEWREGRGVHDVVTARAVAPLPVLVEYAAPLLAIGGALVAWKGTPGPEEEADGAAAASALGLEHAQVLHVEPFRGARDRRLYVYSKVRATPEGFPRRAGMARKRPIRAR
jgi:16S rRNA (guanine527-N7)-methyltransferase